MKTIVTGGAGFIGSHLVKKLVKLGRKVIVIDDFSSGSIENLNSLGIKKSKIEIRKIDLTNFKETKKALRGGNIIFHLAARVGGLTYLHSAEDAELLALTENLAIDANVFKACLENRVKKIIYTSSTAVYPYNKQKKLGTVFSEKDFQIDSYQLCFDPDGGYGLSKIMGEFQLNLIKKIEIGIARLFNIYGENEPIDQKAHAICDLAKKAIHYPKEKFIVWGNGNQTRDYLYVEDCVGALIKIEEKILHSSPLILNIGSGEATPIKEIAEKMILFSGKKIKPTFDLKKPVGPISRTADIEKAKTILNWQPKISLEGGLKRTFIWIQKKLND